MNKIMIVVVVVQVFILAFVAGEREWIIAKGEPVYLRTAPVDPRDIFRGDYVRLDYELAQLDSEMLSDELRTDEFRVIYAGLETDERGVAYMSKLGFEKPDGVFIKGYLNDNGSSWRNRGRIKFGIEKYFVEQGEGISIEKIRGRANEWQSAMEMDIRLGRDGTAVIKGFRWSDVGVKLEMIEPGVSNNNNIRLSNNANPDTPDNQDSFRLSPKLKISVKNQSNRLLKIPDTEKHCAFQLMKNQGFDSTRINSIEAVTFPNRQCDDTTKWRLFELKPGEVYSFEVDMTQATWYVNQGDKLVELGMLPENWQGYRWVYKLPASLLENNKNDNAIWRSTLRTARFNATRRID